jgi:peptidoglycan/xylan/chitin deacetylase (PgdA/CDA1 family)
LNNRAILTNVAENTGQLDWRNHSMVGPAHSFDSQIGEKCVLTYHEILPWESQYLYRVTQAQFKEHLSLLASSTSRPSLEGQLPLITFDDGHRSNFEQAFPLLEQFGLKAAFFVLAGCVGRSDKYLSWDQTRQLVAAGHRVESHGWSHRLLTQCGPSDLEQELVRSKQELEDQLGVPVVAISAPGGRCDDRVADACAQAGYKYLFHSNPWVPSDSRNGIRLQGRHMVTGRMGPSELHRLMQPGGGRRLYFRARYEAKERVRTLLGDRLYHKFWCWLANWSAGEGLEIEVDTLPDNKRESEL